MNVEFPRCLVFDFDVTHGELEVRAWRKDNVYTTRRVRIIATDEASARQRL